MFKTVLFDLDGTLLNSLQDIAIAGNRTLEVLGYPTHPVNAYNQMVGSGGAQLIKRMLPQDKQGDSTMQLALELYRKYYRPNMMNYTAPYPGIVPMLANLKSAGVQLGVLSNKSNDAVQNIVQHYFPATFDAVMGHAPGFEIKPDPASVLHLMQTMDAAKENTLYCGDSDVDIFTARNAGITSCGVLWGFRGEEELYNAGAGYLAEDAEALQQIILQ